MYLTYAEYQIFGGTLDVTTFNLLEFGAESTINYFTFNRLKNDTEYPVEVKYLMMRLIDLEYRKNTALVTGQSSTDTEVRITAQSNDGVSTTYSAMSAEDVYTLCDKSQAHIVSSMLDGVKNQAGQLVLYRGVV